MQNHDLRFNIRLSMKIIEYSPIVTKGVFCLELWNAFAACLECNNELLSQFTIFACNEVFYNAAPHIHILD